MTAQTPAGEPGRDRAAPAGNSTTEQERAAQRDTWKHAQSARNADKRRARFKRAVRQPGPGMIRRPPPEPDGDDAA